MHILLIEDDLDLGAELQRACFDDRWNCRQADVDRSDAGVTRRPRQRGEDYLQGPHSEHVSGMSEATHSDSTLSVRRLEAVSDLT